MVLWFGCLSLGGCLSDGIGSTVGVAPRTPGTDLFLEIFLNNAKVAALAFSGVATLGLTTVAFTLVSGLGAGVFIGHAYALGAAQLLRAVAPHAVLELPALGLAVAAGLVPATAAARRAFGGRGALLGQNLLDAFGLFLASLAALAAAAALETWVSAK